MRLKAVFFSLLLSCFLQGWAATYVIYTTTGQVFQCKEKYQVTADRMIEFQLLSGPILSFSASDIDWLKTSNVNNDPPPDWVEVEPANDEAPQDLTLESMPGWDQLPEWLQKQSERSMQAMEDLQKYFPMNEKGVYQGNAKQMVGLGILVLGMILMLIAWIWLTVIAFGEHWLLGLAMLCCCGSLYYNVSRLVNFLMLLSAVPLGAEFAIMGLLTAFAALFLFIQLKFVIGNWHVCKGPVLVEILAAIAITAANLIVLGKPFYG